MTTPLRLARLSFRTLSIPFRSSFRHASAERAETSTVWVEAECEEGIRGVGEGCPRPYVTGESVTSAETFFHAHEHDLIRCVQSLGALREWVAGHRTVIDDNPAAWCAIELALLDVLGRREGQPIELLLGQPRLSGSFRYSAVLGDMDSGAFAALVERYVGLGFTDFKVKLSGDLERDRAKMSSLARVRPPLRVRVDANNLWAGADEASTFLRALHSPLFAIEEPLAAGRFQELVEVSRACEASIVLDESFTRLEHLEHVVRSPGTWCVNVRVSKMGGLLRSLEVTAALEQAGVRIVVGAQVGETSVLTRAGLAAARAAGSSLVAHEGGFGTHLLRHDVCDPPLMFGAAGELRVDDHPRLAAAGLGIDARV